MGPNILSGAMAVAIIAACWGGGCGLGGTSEGTTAGETSGGMSESASTALSSQIAESAVNGINSGDFATLTLDTIQCNESGCTINVPIDYSVNCTAGGRIAVTGSITGSISSGGTGILQIGATETISDWECITDYIVNGDPYISLTGTFSFMNGAPSTQQSLTLSGGFKWGSTSDESCQIYLSTQFNTSGGGTTTGTVCGYSVYFSF